MTSNKAIATDAIFTQTNQQSSVERSLIMVAVLCTNFIFSFRYRQRTFSFISHIQRGVRCAQPFWWWNNRNRYATIRSFCFVYSVHKHWFTNLSPFSAIQSVPMPHQSTRSYIVIHSYSLENSNNRWQHKCITDIFIDKMAFFLVWNTIFLSVGGSFFVVRALQLRFYRNSMLIEWNHWRFNLAIEHVHIKNGDFMCDLSKWNRMRSPIKQTNEEKKILWK